MQRIHSSENLLLIHHLKNLLEGEGIASYVKNELLRGGAGELAPTDTWPELWVRDDLYAARAMEIVQASLKAEQALIDNPPPNWHCQHCGETNEGQFAACWNCSQALGVD